MELEKRRQKSIYSNFLVMGYYTKNKKFFLKKKQKGKVGGFFVEEYKGKKNRSEGTETQIQR